MNATTNSATFFEVVSVIHGDNSAYDELFDLWWDKHGRPLTLDWLEQNANESRKSSK